MNLLEKFKLRAAEYAAKGVLKMPPHLPKSNLRNMSLGYAMSLPGFFCSPSTVANIKHLILGQFCPAICFPFWLIASVLLLPIPIVVGDRPEEQVIGIDAWRVVASVKDARSVVSVPFGDWAIGDFPGHPMRCPNLLSEIDHSVAAPTGSSGPEPAGFSFVHAAPEPFFRGWMAMSHRARMRTKTTNRFDGHKADATILAVLSKITFSHETSLGSNWSGAVSGSTPVSAPDILPLLSTEEARVS